MNNQTIMQYFEWYLPADGLLWERCKKQAGALKEAGIDMVWLPPAYKGAYGNRSVGYDVYDTYDLGEFNQKGSVATKYGTREAYLEAVRTLQEQGVEVLADIVLNHMMGADATEKVMAEETAKDNREQEIGAQEEILAWTKFEFPGRGGKYSDFCWNASHFSGADWDQAKQRNGIFRFAGKNWNYETDNENGNYDYLMGVDLDTDNPQTVQAVSDWGKWYLDTVKPDGLRLDAVKHIDFVFYKEWLKKMREHAEKNFFAMGEYWSGNVEKLLHYLSVTENTMSLFDVPLHFAFLKAATSNGQFQMNTLFENTLVKRQSQNAITFVDNHDTQPGQALNSFIPAWFKPIAYALILLRKEGIPCVFYGDYYGIPHDGILPVKELKRLLRLRKYYAYGEQQDYFDDPSVVGFTRLGDVEHQNSGMAVLLTDSAEGKKRMYVGTQLAGKELYDVLGHFEQPIMIGQDGWGEFAVRGGSVSVWVTKEAYGDICTSVE